MTVAVAKNTAGVGFAVHNKASNSDGVEFTVSDDVSDSDGNPFTVFGDTIPTEPTDEPVGPTFFVDDNRHFYA